MASSDFMEDLTCYINNNIQHNPQNLSHAESWTVIKAVSTLLTFEVRSGQEQLRNVKWKGFTLPADQFNTRLDAIGIGTLNFETPSQTHWYLGMLHSTMLERVPNSIELIRTVDVAIQGDSEEGKRLLAIKKMIQS